MQQLLRRILPLILFIVPLWAADAPPVEYSVSLQQRADHKLIVEVSYDANGAVSEVQLPVWNATYQVRDFARNVEWLRAKSSAGQALAIRKLDKTTWQVAAARGRITVEYLIVANEPGPFGAQTNDEHTFLNLAEVLVYPVGKRNEAIALHFTDVPPGWKLATSLPSLSSSGETGAPTAHVLHARNYDHLVDSPIELGNFQESDFDSGGAHYRVIVHADPKNYNAQLLIDSLKKITDAETDWMRDRPFNEYVFIYHFPNGPAGGGMEHAYSTAIDISADRLARDAHGFEDVSAHEFFHLWNVKRIRTQTLEPLDYTKEMYTRALWFSEGCTSTVAAMVLEKAGLSDEPHLLRQIAVAVQTLESRPAHLTQSAEESSLDTWFDKYADYREPERSINYYNKGYLLGILLDLQIREASHGAKSLRDLFNAMNERYAKAGKFFPDSDGVRETAESLTGTDLKPFFAKYVAGTDELPYDQLFATVGLKLDHGQRTVADLGITFFRNFSAAPAVSDVKSDSAKAAGVQPGDTLLKINGAAPGGDDQLRSMKPGDKVTLALQRRNGETRDVTITLGSRQADDYKLVDLPQITAAQRARRKAWLASEDEVAAAH